MRKGWEYKKLGEVTSFFRGLTYSGKDEVDKSNNIVLRSNNIDLSTNSLNFDELKFISDSITIPQDKKIRKNSIFMCMSNGSKQHLGKVAFIEKEYPYAFGGFMGLIVPNEDKLVPKFTYYYFCSQKFKAYLSAIGNGANINNIKYIDIAKDSIPLPPLSTQLAIVTELDKINELIRLKKEQLKDFDNLAQSLFYEMFGDPVENEKGWEMKKLGEIGEVKTRNTPSRSNDNFYNEKFIEWIKTDNIRNEQMNPTTAAEYLSRDGAECGRIVSKGSILVACIAGSLSSIGKCCITTKNVAFNQQINAITPYGDFCNSIYLYELIRNSYKYIQQNATTGMKHILSKSVFEKMKFPLPPLSLQRLFAQRIEQIEREKSEVQKSIQDLETLLASRMQYWFE